MPKKKKLSVIKKKRAKIKPRKSRLHKKSSIKPRKVSFVKKIKKSFSLKRKKLKKKKSPLIRLKIKKQKSYSKPSIKTSRRVKSVQRPKTKKRVTSRKPKKPAPETEFLTQSFFKAKIKVIGIGGGGSSIVSEIGRSLDKAKFVIADTDTRNFKKRKGIKYFSFGQKLTHGLGSGLNPNLGKIAAEQEKERIASLFEEQDMLIFVASLGGGVGSGAGPVFAEISKNFNGISFGIFTLPFKFEGKNKYKIASNALAQLRKSLNVSIAIANERIFKIIDSNTAITDAFSLVNKNLIESLESLIDLIYNPGVINIDFADLRTILKGKGSLAFLNTTEISGKDKLEKITKELLHNPLYYQNPTSEVSPSKGGGNHFTGERVLFNIMGGHDLSMLEVDKISKIISEQNPKAKIIFGISKNPKYKNKIKTTILIAGLPIIKDRDKSKVAVEKPRLIQELSKKSELNKAVKKIKNIKIKKKKKVIRQTSPSDLEEKKNVPDISSQIFGNIPINIESSIKSIAIETPGSENHSSREFLTRSQHQKKTIRRTALEIKKAQEVEENEKSQQEKEWEIPAFLRKVHRIK